MYRELGESFTSEIPDENNSKGKQDPENQKNEITIEAKYTGDNPEKFVIDLIKKAHEQGVRLTFKEVMKQVEEALNEAQKEEEFNFDNMQAKSASIIIPKEITITIKAKPSQEEAEEVKEEEQAQDNDDDVYNDEKRKKKEKTQRKTDKKDDIFETEIMKVRDALETPEGIVLNQSLEKIKEIGKRLVGKLKALGNNKQNIETLEPDDIQTSSLKLFRFLEEAEDSGQKLTKKLKEDFDIILHRSLVPSEYIMAYLYKIYKEKNIKMPNKILNSRRSGSSLDTLQKAVDTERLK